MQSVSLETPPTLAAAHHPTAIIHVNAIIEDNVTIGPYTIIGENVTIKSGTTIGAHSHIEHAVIGRENRIAHGVMIGGQAQSIKLKNNQGQVLIGDSNVIKEHVVIHRGYDGRSTKIGNNTFLMSLTHVGHDCDIGSHVVLTQSSVLGGHIKVDDYAVIHQFSRIGKYAMIGGCSCVVKDVPPYSLVYGNPASFKGVNFHQLKKLKLDMDTMQTIDDILTAVTNDPLAINDYLDSDYAKNPHLDELISFIKFSTRGICSKSET